MARDDNDEQPSFEMGDDSWACTGRLSVRRNNARMFRDPDHPELVFMIPKQWVRGGWLMRDEVSAMVYMSRGDPTRVMDIDGMDFTLYPARYGRGKGQTVSVEGVILHRTARRAEVLLRVRTDVLAMDWNGVSI